MRLILRQARIDQGLSARVVGDRIAARLKDLGDDHADPPSTSTIYAWEKFERHPSISSYAAWARVLGYRLIVELDAAESRRMPVLVRTTEAAEIARRVDAMPEEKRKAVLSLVRTM